MTQPVRFEYTDTFENSVNNAIAHKSQFTSELEVIERIENLVGHFEGTVEANPEIYPLCQDLVELGVTSVRHAVKDGFRIIYEVNNIDGEFVILVSLFLDQRQSIQKQLIDYCLIYK